MRFTVNDQIYTIEFQRHHVEVLDPVTREYKDSMYPSTTVKILQYQPDTKAKDWPIAAAATVNCLPTDKFSHEAGRLYALRKVGHVLPFRMREAMWEAYHNRERTTPKNLTKENEQLRKENAALKLKIREISSETERIS